MIGDFLNNNSRRKVKTREDQRLFMGKKYRRESETRVLCLHLGGQEKTTRGYVGRFL